MSENESEKRETSADIADEIRRAVESMGDEMPYTVSAGTMRRVADRINAACERESTPTTEKSSAVGNAAAMREALEAINRIETRGLKYLLMQLVEADIYDGGLINKTISAVEKARRSLSAPARNCDAIDLPTDCNSQKIHVSDRVHMLNTDCRGDHEWDDEVCSLEYVGEGGGDLWLIHGKDGVAWACECEVLAPAAERKGEGDVHL